MSHECHLHKRQRILFVNASLDLMKMVKAAFRIFLLKSLNKTKVSNLMLSNFFTIAFFLNLFFFNVYHFTDINECKGNHSCHANATCMNTKGSYVCTCHLGYTGNGSDCTGTWCISFETISIRKKTTIIFARLVLPAYLVLTLSLLRSH